MKETITLLSTPTKAKLKNPPKAVRNLVSDVLSYKVEAAGHETTASWDSIMSMYDYSEDTFPAGFCRLVKKKLVAAGYKVRHITKEIPEPLGPLKPVVDDYAPDPRYDYQEHTMETLIKMRSMIAQVATGGGKSRIFKLCQQRIGRTTLFVTTRKSLMYQMAKEFKKSIGGSVGILGDGNWTPNENGVNFAIVDTLASRLDMPKIESEVEKALTRNHNKIEKEIKKRLEAQKLPTTKVPIKMPDSMKKKIETIRRQVEKELSEPRKVVEVKIRKKLARKIKEREETLALLSKIEFLCLEEAHEIGSDSFFSVSNACKNAHYRLALTATPFMRDSQEANMRLMAATGPVAVKVSEQLLIDRGILATPKFAYKDIHTPKGVIRSTPFQAAYRAAIVEHSPRNEVVVNDVINAKRYGLTSMILIAHKAHGEILQKMLEDKGVRCAFISGDDDQNTRQRYLNMLGNGEIDCLIGSTILDVGVDVPSVGYVGLAGAGKAEVAIRQRIGRGLRAKKSGPNVCFVRDFTDLGNTNLHRHSKERRRIVESTPGFKENIVEEFDFKSLGFKRCA